MARVHRIAPARILAGVDTQFSARIMAVAVGMVLTVTSASVASAADRATADWTTRLAPSAAVASAIDISGDSKSTSITLRLDRKVKAGVFTLPEPFRLIVDIADLSFALPPGSGSRSVGLVSRFRYGSLSPGRSRLVFDLGAPVKIARTVSTSTGLKIELLRVGRNAYRPRKKSRKVVLRPGRYADIDRNKKGRRKKPLIVIDPGHGGVDPGAVSGALYEKQITLDVGLKLRDALAKTKEFNVITTRVSDTFVSLDQRAAIAEDVGADLFLSIHADSVADAQAAQNIRGATVYMLSEQASDHTARMLAEKENASDTLGGVETQLAATKDTVRSILVDLMRRETVNHALAFREKLISSLGRKIRLSASPRRQAAFRVLRQIGTPAVLVELGYMSNQADQKLMQTKKWQKKVAQAMAQAIGRHFQRRK